MQSQLNSHGIKDNRTNDWFHRRQTNTQNNKIRWQIATGQNNHLVSHSYQCGYMAVLGCILNWVFRKTERTANFCYSVVVIVWLAACRLQIGRLKRLPQRWTKQRHVSRRFIQTDRQAEQRNPFVCVPHPIFLECLLRCLLFFLFSHLSSIWGCVSLFVLHTRKKK